MLMTARAAIIGFLRDVRALHVGVERRLIEKCSAVQGVPSRIGIDIVKILYR
jgi:hypothetical protein